MQLEEIELSWLKDNPYQPRQKMDETALVELMDSIRSVGLLQPPLVARQEDSFSIIAGHRRVEACRRLGLQKLVVGLISAKEPQFLAQAALVENLQRHDLNPLEVALSLAKLQKEFGYTHETLAQVIGKKRVSVTHFLRLLYLDPEVQEAVGEGLLTMGHAKCLAVLSHAQQRLWLKKLEKAPLSVHALEKQLSKAVKKTPKRSFSSTAQELREKLVCQFKLRAEAFVDEKGSGWIKLHFKKPEDLWQLWKENAESFKEEP